MKFLNRKSGKALNVAGGFAEENVKIIIWDEQSPSADNEQWIWVGNGQIKSVSSKLMLDVDEKGDVVQRKADGKAKGQVWTIKSAQLDAPPLDALKVGTVWQGMCEQTNPNASYPMVLYIKRRSGNAFEATAWYPTVADGLVTVSGKVGPNGAVTFMEDQVIHGEGAAGRQGVLAGGRFTVTLDRGTLMGTGECQHPELKGTMTLKVSLKLAQ
ncbi:MAG: RICIN domain-containing protein [Gemmataceae bacterium]